MRLLPLDSKKYIRDAIDAVDDGHRIVGPRAEIGIDILGVVSVVPS